MTDTPIFPIALQLLYRVKTIHNTGDGSSLYWLVGLQAKRRIFNESVCISSVIITPPSRLRALLLRLQRTIRGYIKSLLPIWMSKPDLRFCGVDAYNSGLLDIAALMSGEIILGLLVADKIYVFDTLGN